MPWAISIFWSSKANVHNPMLDERARLWFTSKIRPNDNPAFCKAGSDHRSAKLTPVDNSGRQLGMYDPASNTWREWRLPGDRPQPYAVYVDDRDIVWLSDFGSNSLVRFDPGREAFDAFPLPISSASVRQLLGRPGEVWGAESGADKLVRVRTQR